MGMIHDYTLISLVFAFQMVNFTGGSRFLYFRLSSPVKVAKQPRRF
uniref:Uncharacterized protein n=1 Tax=Rhizophora mucronata TaxID=61149 RepID=A0A2P2Q946_RHIMU